MLNPDGINEGHTITDLIKTVKEVTRMSLREELKKLGFAQYFQTPQQGSNHIISLHVKEDKVILLRETRGRDEHLFVPLIQIPGFPEEQLKALKKYLEE